MASTMRSRSAFVGLRLEVLDHLDVDALLAEDLERAARLAAHRVVVHPHRRLGTSSLMRAQATARRRRGTSSSAVARRPSATSSRYRPRGTSTAPSDARCGVVHCTSSRVPPPSRMRSTSATTATFDASVTRWNFDSAANRPPMLTPYSPPTSASRSLFVVLPRLHAVRPSEFVQLGVRGDELLVDPTVRTLRVGAAAHHVFERGVDPDLEPSHRTSQRSADVAARRAG